MTDETVETPTPEPVAETTVTADPPAEAVADPADPPAAEEPSTAPSASSPAPGADRPRATGKRKTSVARVIINRGGDGGIICNGRPIEEYFPRPALVRTARSPLTVTGLEGQVTVIARLDGGGVTGQAGALRHGIARALVEFDESLRPELKREGMLARDARIKERKKAGLRGARKRPQFSKR
jgi:small subunit ribosomal protein S9